MKTVKDLRQILTLYSQSKANDTSLCESCFAYKTGVETSNNMVRRTRAILANHSHVSGVGQAVGDIRLVVMLPPLHASFL